MFKVMHFKELDSTMDKAKEIPVGTAIVADKQTKGRGRFDRSWSSEEGGVYMSLVIKTEIENMKFMTFITALAVRKAVFEVCSVEAGIKWPNDLVYEGKKLCGMLTENVVAEDSKMVVGIGLNVNNDVEEGISVKEIKGKEFDKEEIIKNILKNFEHYYKKNKKEIIAEWKELSDTIGRDVRVDVFGNGEIVGKAIDVDSDCNLIVEKEDGSREVVVEGTIS